MTSVRSNYSDRSAGFYTSNAASGSVTSFASSSGTSGGGASIQRRIVPLYNLSAHNVMTNTVTDAGTDAKVAKFQRRGLEIMRVGTWEPIEVWSSKSSPSSAGGAASSQRHYQTIPNSAAAASHTTATPATTAVDDVGRLPRASSLTSGGQELNATAFSMVSDGTGKESSMPSSPSFMKKLASSASGSGHRRQNSIDPSVPVSPPPPNNAKEVAVGAKKFFGKVFNTSNSKKREGGSASGLNFPSFNLAAPPGSAPGQRTSFSASVGAGGRESAARRLSSLSSGSKESHSDSTSASHIAPAQQHNSTLLHPPSYSRESNSSYSSGHWYGERDPPPLQPPVLGLQAALHASVAPGAQLNGRPNSYVWVMRRWAKEKQPAGSQDGILKGLVNVAQGLQQNAGVGARKEKDKDVLADVEVRFEWSRGKSMSKEKARPAGAGAGAASRRVSDQSATLRLPSIDDDSRSMNSSSKNPSRTSLVQHQQHAGASGSGAMEPTVPSASISSRRHSTHNTGDISQQIVVPDATPGAAAPPPADDGEESDAEDSETPWTCTLQIFPAHLPPLTEAEAKERHNSVFCAPPPSSSSSSPKPVRDGRLRIRLAVLVPTPHHPKIIGQFKMPFPLPDVAITPYASLSVPNAPHSFDSSGTSSRAGRFDVAAAGVGARALPRTIGPDGVLRLMSDSGNGEMEINVAQEILFTAEDIKDVVSSTGLWLVVREGFGGLGRTKRKGDGWHIRA